MGNCKKNHSPSFCFQNCMLSLYQARFIREFKLGLVDCSSQGWHDQISPGERFEHYREFNQTLEYERYLKWLRSKIYRDVIVQFRLGIAIKTYIAQMFRCICALCAKWQRRMKFILFSSANR